MANINENDQSADRLLNGIKSYEKGSSKLTTWSLSIVGGSILIIIDDSYFRPFTQCFRYAYFLFLIGWVLIAISLYYAFAITRSVMVTDLYTENPSKLISILRNCNKFFIRQLRLFQWGLLVFGMWLVLYLIWWIFATIPAPSS